jgi:hypothetical protein
MQTTVTIKGNVNVEVPLELFNETILNNLNEDQLFDILMFGVSKRKFTTKTIIDRINDDYKDEFDEIILDKTKELQHYKDSTAGLFCTDRPELFNDEYGIMFKLEGDKDELNLINRVDSWCASSLDPETYEKWGDVKKVLFETRKLLK